MIRKIKRLLQIKETKEQDALRALRLKRQELAGAEQERDEAIALCDESHRTLPAREDALYETVLGKVVDQIAIDKVKADVTGLQNQHQELVDDVTRMQHVVERLQSELATAKEHHSRCVRVREKYVYLRDRMVLEKLELEDAKEENEIEEIFAKPVKKPGQVEIDGA